MSGGRSSKRKGASGERELAAALHDALGVRLVRNLEQSRSGGHDLDVDADDTGNAAEALRGFAIECKRVRAAPASDVALWWRQTCAQAVRADRVPLLAYRADRGAWAFVLPLAVLVPGAVCTMTVDVAGLVAIVDDRGVRGLPAHGARRSTELTSTTATEEIR